MSEDEKKQNVVPTLRSFLIEAFGALAEISSKADKADKVLELEAQLIRANENADMRSKWWSEEYTKTNNLQKEVKELKDKLAIYE